MCCNPEPSVNKTNLPVSQECKVVDGIKMCPNCLTNGTCSFSIYQFLGIRKSLDNSVPPSPTLFVQDIILAATTFIGTILTIVFIVSGLMFIFAGATGKEPGTAKKGMINSIIGLVIVICSYAIIRLVQYIAKGF